MISRSPFYRPLTKFAKVMFSQAFVCPQGGGDLHPGGWGLHLLGVCIQGEGSASRGRGSASWVRGSASKGGVCIQGAGGSASGGGQGSMYRGGGGRGACICGAGRSTFKGWAGPPQSDTMGYGQRADGTHPTGMHSCY